MTVTNKLTHIVCSFQVHTRAPQRGRAPKWECLQELRPGNSKRLNEQWKRRRKTGQAWVTLLCLRYIRPLWAGHEGQDHHLFRHRAFDSSIIIITGFNFRGFIFGFHFLRFLCSTCCCIIGQQFGLYGLSMLNLSLLVLVRAYYFVWLFEGINYSHNWICI